MNQPTDFLDKIPEGNSRLLVRGFLASNSWSAHRLKAMAEFRAVTMQINTKANNFHGKPPDTS